MFGLTERQLEITKKVIKLVLILLLTVGFIFKVLPYIAPLVVGIIMTFIIEKPVQFMEKKFKMSRSLAVATAVFLFVVVIGGMVIFSFYKLTMELAYLTKDTPALYSIAEFLQDLIERSQNFYLDMPQDIVNTLERNIGSIMRTISSWLTDLFGVMLGIVKSLPQLFIFLIISIVSTFFMSRDRDEISRFLYRQMPDSWGMKFRSIKTDLFVAFIGYLKAQLTLLLITFFELLLGYTILGVDYAFFFAIFTAVVDAIPVLGTGTILIPVSAAHLMMGNSPRALAFLILYIVILIARQFLEPRIIGSNLGIHPLIMLMSIYIGLKIFGVVGLIVGPVLVIIIKALQKAELIPKFR